jgi:hypothetical protein
VRKTILQETLSCGEDSHASQISNLASFSALNLWVIESQTKRLRFSDTQRKDRRRTRAASVFCGLPNWLDENAALADHHAGGTD